MRPAIPEDEPCAALVLLACGQCGAELKVEAGMRTTVCPYCDAPTVVERPASLERPDPVFVVGFVLPRDAAIEQVRRWLGSRSIFAPSGLAAARLEKTRGVYLPAYLYCASAHCQYTAEIGETYTTTETYTDSQGKTRTRTRTKTEWRHLAGRYSCYVSDRLVTASRGLPNDALEAVEPFDLRAIRRYSPAMVSGWLAEEPSLPREQCSRMAHSEAIEEVARSLTAFMPGDSYRTLEHRTTFEDEHIDLVLLPLWVFSARYHPDKPPIRICVNGQTGAVGGSVPLSYLKIALAVLVVLAIAAAVAIAVSSR